MESTISRLPRLVAIHNLQLNIIKASIHDLRSPLSGISGYVDLMDMCLNTTRDVNKIERYKNQVAKGLEEIYFFVEQLQEVATERVNAESEEFQEKTDICWIVSDICEKMRGLCHYKKIELDFEKSDDTIDFSLDIVLLKMVVLNLINNAIKYTAKSGKISVGVFKKDSSIDIRIKSAATIRSTVDIKKMFLQELSNSNGTGNRPGSDQNPYYFGAVCVELIHSSAKISVDEANSFTVSILLKEG